MSIGSRVYLAAHMEDQVDSDDDLKEALKKCGIPKLYRKLNRACVTSEILWNLTDDMQEEIGFTKIENLSYNNAKKKHRKQSEQSIG